MVEQALGSDSGSSLSIFTSVNFFIFATFFCIANYVRDIGSICKSHCVLLLLCNNNTQWLLHMELMLKSGRSDNLITLIMEGIRPSRSLTSTKSTYFRL